MTFLVLFILAVVWAVYLVSWVRGKTAGRRVNSIHSFSSHLSILERTAPEEVATVPVAPRTAPLLDGQYFAPHRPQLSPVKKRRRDVLFILAGATGVTFLGVIGLGGSFMLLLFVLSAGALVAYVYQLVQLRKRAEERAGKVRPIGQATPARAARAVDRPTAPVVERNVVASADAADDVLGAVFGDLSVDRRAVGH